MSFRKSTVMEYKASPTLGQLVLLACLEPQPRDGTLDPGGPISGSGPAGGSVHPREIT